MPEQKEKLGVKFLDELLNGGVPAKSIILVEGTSGIGQNVLLYHFLFQGVREQDRAVYVFSGHLLDEILDEFESYSMEVKKGEISWVDASNSNEDPAITPCDLSELFTVSSAIKKNLAGKKSKTQQTRLAMDMVSPALMSNDSSEVYKFLSSLISELKKNNVTAMLVIEDAMHDPHVVASIEQLCDGVIEMKAIEKDLEIETVLRIKKMRNIPPFQKCYRYKVTGEGIVEKRE